MTRPIELFHVTELSLPRLVLHALLGRDVRVVSVASVLREGLTGLLQRIVARLMQRANVSAAADTCPELAVLADRGDFMRLTDPFTEAEPWLEDHFRFATADRRFGAYGRAFRHLCCNRAFVRLKTAHLMRQALACAEGRGRAWGVGRFEAAFLRHRFGLESKGLLAVDGMAAVLLDGAAVAVALASTWRFVVARTLDCRRVPEPVFLASDYVEGYPRDEVIWDDLRERGLNVLVVYRSQAQKRAYPEQSGKWPTCVFGEGFLTPAQGVRALFEATRDILRLAVGGIGLPSEFFLNLVRLPYRRMGYRALLNRHPARAFWGRDDYNTEHIVRSQELRKAGTVSLGVMHGIPALVRVAQQLRHVDFDVYFVHGTLLHEKYYRDTWPAHMVVEPVGTACLSRSDLRRLQHRTRRDILCIPSPSFHEDLVFETLVEVSRAFPDKTLYLNVKSSYLHGAFLEKIERCVAARPGAIVIDQGRSYHRFAECAYIVTESTTLTAEAIQFGVVPVVLDLSDRIKFLVYREYPELCVHSAAQAIERIRRFEEGRESLEPPRYAGLITIPDRDYLDILHDRMSGSTPGGSS